MPERLQAGRVTATFFPTLGINPVVGRFFNPEEDRAGNERSVVLSTALWKRLYGSKPSALNGSIQLNGDSYQVVGVAPEGGRTSVSGRGIDGLAALDAKSFVTKCTTTRRG